MQSTQAQLLNRSRSNGAEKRAPPPIKPKPSALASSSVDSSAPSPTFSSSSSSSSTLPRTTITVTDNGLPTSSSFGDLKKTFERQQNSSPLFLGGGVGASGMGGASTGSGYPSHASIARVQQQTSSSLGVPVLSSNSRPRSLSSPAPPHRETGDSSAVPSGTGPPLASSAVSSAKEDIDQSQPDFGNLRARFQSQASLSSVSLPRPVSSIDTARVKKQIQCEGGKRRLIGGGVKALALANRSTKAKAQTYRAPDLAFPTTPASPDAAHVT
ncbi:hypothetical protein BGZ72_003492 [Mortierella alpina]|nr:hypothetical protein BGZ72_003492 [Mortierella alpina]